jgi:hypothetical protein
MRHFLVAETNDSVDPAILTLQAPTIEEIARAIWQRQHDARGADAIAANIGWRDPSLPTRYWDEFLKDAHAVLSLLHGKRVLVELD